LAETRLKSLVQQTLRELAAIRNRAATLLRSLRAHQD